MLDYGTMHDARCGSMSTHARQNKAHLQLAASLPGVNCSYFSSCGIAYVHICYAWHGQICATTLSIMMYTVAMASGLRM